MSSALALLFSQVVSHRISFFTFVIHIYSTRDENTGRAWRMHIPYIRILYYVYRFWFSGAQPFFFLCVYYVSDKKKKEEKKK